jgi:hypothetical protein
MAIKQSPEEKVCQLCNKVEHKPTNELSEGFILDEQGLSQDYIATFTPYGTGFP